MQTMRCRASFFPLLLTLGLSIIVTPSAAAQSGSVEVMTETVASGVTVPWEIVFAPDGRIFFTEQRGRLRVIKNGRLLATPALDYTSRVPGGEAGMLGLEIDRNFSSNRFLYVFYCYNSASTSTGVRCRVSRLVMSGDRAREDKVLLDFLGVGKGRHHNAGRIKIGPDNLLYVATGDLSSPARSQNRADLAGKILRMNLDGRAAAGNPFPNNYRYVYAYGLRDPQGLAFDSSGQLYCTEHGATSRDEVNIIRPGGNYGWPTCQGRCRDSRFIDPVRLYLPETAAPSGATFYYGGVIPQWNGSLLFATMGHSDNRFAHHIRRIKFAGPGSMKIVAESAIYRDRFGRIRTVVQGPDGFVYFSTSNGGGKDKIVRIRPKP